MLDWTAAALNRVNRAAFFQKFQDEHAVQYFYEPFLEAFDPELRKDLGVWYTPPEIVQYQVARVDTVLREELGLADGLADPNVVVLDPCCGTGAYLVEVLKRIAETLKAKGGDALIASDLKRAAMTRVFGFEILPAPFVVSHLQLGLMLHHLGAPLSVKTAERVGVYLTNALTGWEPPKEPKKLLFPELEAERDAADGVKRDKQILVILGNPPYNGFAGVAVTEERELTTAYRATKKAPPPQGQGLNDLYIRFCRMAERRIVEMNAPGRGVVCFISNYSWLDGLSFTGMRERYLEAFDRVWIDCLNGDKYKTGKLTPEGEPDPSIFSTEHNREGIQIGTAIALLVRKAAHAPADAVSFRHLWGKQKRSELLASAGHDDEAMYQKLKPAVEIGCPFMPTLFASNYMKWPSVPDLLPWSSPAVKTSRDSLVVDIDKANLIARMKRYLDKSTTNDEVLRFAPVAMSKTGTFDPDSARRRLVNKGFCPNRVISYAYRPFDKQWVYWEPETNLLDRKREDLFAAQQGGNLFLTSRQKGERTREGSPFYATSALADYHLTRPGSTCFPLYRPAQDGLDFDCASTQSPARRPNLSELAANYLARPCMFAVAENGRADALWMHVMAIGHSPEYLQENAGMLWQDWPRIPLPDGRKALEASADLGRQVAALLDTEAAVAGVTGGKVEPIFRTVAVASRVGGGAWQAEDFAVTAGWGHAGKGGVTMPAKGRIVQRPYDKAELDAIADAAKARGLSTEQAIALVGPDTRDVYLNEKAYWRNVPAGVWEYFIGGYQVIKKWLSYREQELLGRPLSSDEAHEVTGMARRLAAIVLLQPALDANYRQAAASAYAWPKESGSRS